MEEQVLVGTVQVFLQMILEICFYFDTYSLLNYQDIRSRKGIYICTLEN